MYGEDNNVSVASPNKWHAAASTDLIKGSSLMLMTLLSY